VLPLRYSDAEGQLYCKNCPQGSQSRKKNVEAPSLALGCESCVAGKYANLPVYLDSITGGSNAGGRDPATLACKGCEAGKFAPSANASGCKSHTTCPSGYFPFVQGAAVVSTPPGATNDCSCDSSVELCGPHIAIPPAMVRSFNESTSGEHTTGRSE